MTFDKTIKPMVKKTVFIREKEKGLLRVGELTPDRAAEIEDEDGFVQQLIQRMDGTRTIDQIWADLQSIDSPLTADELSEFISELDSFGLLDNLASAAYNSFSSAELERYKANLNYFTSSSSLAYSPWEMQRRLNRAKITIIGVGTLGSGVLFNLAGLGVENIRIVDFDRVELSNLNRQLLYKEEDIGRRKIDAAMEFIRSFHSRMKLECIPVEIRSTADAENAIAGSDFVVLAADQPSFLLERWVNQACVKLGIPFIGGGVNGVEGQLYTVVPGRTGCLDCNYLNHSRQDEEYLRFLQQYISSGFRMPSTAIAPNYMILTGMACGEAVRLITRTSDMQSEGKVVSIHFETFQTAIKMDFTSPSPDCPTCGHGIGKEPIFRFFRDWEESTNKCKGGV
ncbi:ThiF family adenylyltransferase [Cohnella sp. CFH 77786]|uniref:HesA/MoeB/ThiF family protein n=1 Tax=Cohnella sp. CFH 77786 TaxID=2662265 RepID=UPI001C60C350|nr:ThiF family adenylyltransferase [Cohnella sp. CFH 77786]MBW5446198.1 ThiF family adenylyltransferase [Cohnella sp. CFH 77786]